MFPPTVPGTGHPEMKTRAFFQGVHTPAGKTGANKKTKLDYVDCEVMPSTQGKEAGRGSGHFFVVAKECLAEEVAFEPRDGGVKK